ncbi:Nitrogen assimilation regulatory protein [Serratia rubidaea]|uniref:Nitrogen assimilation regulatory protein n=1 Tax=Serratia rubidaea TaxID=61652 RepID=A0A447QLM6_SERRU|nr:Nitrogen assimilation regulatory protein [Serratia rubidaea]
MQRGIVWIVDDDSSIRWVLERALTGVGMRCATFDSGNAVLEALSTQTPDVLLSDIRMPGMDGLALLKQIKQRHPMLPVIIMTAHSDLDAAVSAYQQGAFDYLRSRSTLMRPSRWSNAPSATIRSSNSRRAASPPAARPPTLSAKRRRCRTSFALSAACRAHPSAC